MAHLNIYYDVILVKKIIQARGAARPGASPQPAVSLAYTFGPNGAVDGGLALRFQRLAVDRGAPEVSDWLFVFCDFPGLFSERRVCATPVLLGMFQASLGLRNSNDVPSGWWLATVFTNRLPRP